MPSHEPVSVPVESRATDTGQRVPTVADLNRDDLTGWRLESYDLGQKIGGGGMGAVFRARHVHLGRTFAIKFVAAAVSDSTEAHQRFEQETRALGQLSHPRIVNAVDAGLCGGLRYLVTELIDGDDFQRLVTRSGPVSFPHACRLISAAAEGLAYAHHHGFVHRDIKPSNLIVDRAGDVTILDFGLVREAGEASELTSDHAVLGTWDYIAPEQAEDATAADARSDLYSLGGTLLFLLSGEPPFSGAKYRQGAAKLKGHLLKTPAWLESPPTDVPKELVEVVARMMAKSPEERFASADEVVAALAPFIPSTPMVRSALPPIPRPTRAGRWKLVASASVLTGLGLSLWFYPPYGGHHDTNGVKDGTPASKQPAPNEAHVSSELPAALSPLVAEATTGTDANRDVPRPAPTGLDTTENPGTAENIVAEVPLVADVPTATPPEPIPSDTNTAETNAGPTYAADSNTAEPVAKDPHAPSTPDAGRTGVAGVRPLVHPRRITVMPERTNSALPFTLSPKALATRPPLGPRGPRSQDSDPQD